MELEQAWLWTCATWRAREHFLQNQGTDDSIPVGIARTSTQINPIINWCQIIALTISGIPIYFALISLCSRNQLKLKFQKYRFCLYFFCAPSHSSRLSFLQSMLLLAVLMAWGCTVSTIFISGESEYFYFLWNLSKYWSEILTFWPK